MKRLFLLFAALCCMATMQAETKLIKFRDYDAATGLFKDAARECTMITRDTRTLEGGWYAVQGSVKNPHGLKANGTVHLILCDGSSLTVDDSVDHSYPGVSVRAGNVLSIYGQTAGTGILTASGSPGSAGIGGGGGQNGGTVTICGGTIVAQGGAGAAGIGGGWNYISGGGGGGTITIHGGTVTATGGAGESPYAGAGIGGGYAGAGGQVKIDGGAVKAKGGECESEVKADPIGNGSGGRGCQVEISGGLFSNQPKAAWIASGCEVVRNTDVETRERYVWKVEARLLTVTIGTLSHTTASWTSGDGLVQNAIEGTSFQVKGRTENVKVIFTPEVGYDLVGDAVVDLGTVTDNIIFGGQSGYTVPEAVRNGAIIFRDYDAATGVFKDAARECTLVTDETRVLESGWYAVQGEVTIPEGDNLTVNGTVHLILCDGAKLRVVSPKRYQAGVQVENDASLVIYGQTAGTGALTAQGGDYGAGIGGSTEFYYTVVGLVTINGGIVTATGGKHGAGIGGGSDEQGGTVTIHGGIVTATGGEAAAGIGGGQDADGGTVTINGGIVTATGGESAAGIGGGLDADGGTVRIAGGAVTAHGQNGAQDIGGGWSYEGTNNGTIQIAGGIFWKEPKAEWLYNAKVEDNTDPETSSTYPSKVTGVDIPYLDWDPVTKQTKDALVKAINWIEVTDTTRTLTDGWYVVRKDVVIPDDAHLTVNGSAHLILGDGAALTIANPRERAAIAIGAESSLAIYQQAEGTGRLRARGAVESAGIGSTAGDVAGAVTINGGIVTAQGGGLGAGIGGGKDGSGGTITINAGTVTAESEKGPGIGVGCGLYGPSGSITINGGMVTAIGGDYDGQPSSGLGIIYPAAVPGGQLTVSGGKVWVNGEVFREGIDTKLNCAFSGGIFNVPIPEMRCAYHFAPSANYDPDTQTAYPYTVVPGWEVRIGAFRKMSATWTCSDNSVSNAIDSDSTFFKVPDGTDHVAVHFKADPGYYLDDAATVSIGTVTEDIVFGEGNAYAVPRVYNPFGDISYLRWNGTQMEEAILSKYDYTLVTDKTKEMTDGWYVVAQDINSTGIKVNGVVNLILVDGIELKVAGIDHRAGITVLKGNELAIYGGANGTGTLTATGGNGAAGIGGNFRGVGEEGHGDCGTVTIHGGTVTAQGGTKSAGIGGGNDILVDKDGRNLCGGNGGTVTIYGGTVTATGGERGAGIGGGLGGNGGKCTINGGTVTAQGGDAGTDMTNDGDIGAAGIGAGYAAWRRYVITGDTIIINGGTVTALGGERGPGIGGGHEDWEDPGLCVITGGAIKAQTHGEKTQDICFGPKDSEYKQGKIQLWGGIFARELQKKWVPNVCVVVENPDGGTREEYPWTVMDQERNILCFTANSAGSTVNLKKVGEPNEAKLEYYTSNAAEWQTYQLGDTIKLAYRGDFVRFRNASDDLANGLSKDSTSNYYQFVMTGSIAASGNVMSLIDKSCKATTFPEGSEYCFAKLFSGCTSLTSAPELPATTLTPYCYTSMFKGCTGLETAPTLPATSLALSCYDEMFNGCSKLNKVRVAFTEWTNNTTNDWLEGVASTGTFVCLEELDKTKRGASYIPEGWITDQLTTFTITAGYSGKGMVSGGGTYMKGDKVTLTATPAEYYVFEKWSDGTTANPYVFTATKDVTLTAFFKKITLNITDGTEYTATESKFLLEVIYTRTFDNTNWQALYVPFSMNYDEWSEKYEIAKIHNFIEYDDDDNGEFDRTYLVVLKLTSGSTKPNYPYLIRAKETGTHSLVLQDKTLEAAEITSIDCRSVENEYTFTGTYTPVTDMYANGYYALSGGALNKANSAGVTLGAQRWYMEVTSRTGGAASVKAQSIQILVDGEEGIETPSNSPEGGEPVAYDLMGRMVSVKDNVRGVNIVNGKKLIK